MRVELEILIGSSSKKGASKTIELDFAPVVGMHYQDVTWKANEEKEIKNVVIVYPPNNETPYLTVALEPDASAAVDALEPIYNDCGWTIR